jgi:predicted DsbA family dithiol-disulfide isomerase
MTAQSQTPVRVSSRIQIEVFSDVVCPWCFIGKRRLEEALRRLPQSGDPASGYAPPEVRWRAFQLNPWLPREGMDRAEYVARKFGSAAGDVYGRVARVGRHVGIPFAFDRIARQPNTVDAHRLVRLAGLESRQDAMVETLFQAYFLEGADLTSEAVLLDLAQRAGLDPQRAQACLHDERIRAAVLDEDRMARELGVEGVPFFVFDRRLAVSGAQEPEVLLRAMDRAARDGAHSPA